MSIKDFIKKAIEGGWPGWQTAMEIWWEHNPHQMFLDPEAWKAVGKVEGWSANVACNKCGTAINGWKAKMHRMIDALVEGKTIEEFLETL